MSQPFSIVINVAGARSYGTSEGDLPTGGYQCFIASCEQQRNKAGDGDNLVLDLQVAEGKLYDADQRNAGRTFDAYRGRTKRVWVGVPGSTSNPEKNGHYQGSMRAFLESLGVTAAALDTGAITLTNDMIQGKPCYLWNVESDGAVEGNDSFMRPDQYQKYIAGTFSPPVTTKPRTDRQGGGAGGTGLGGALGTAMPSGATSVNPLAGGAPGAVGAAVPGGAPPVQGAVGIVPNPAAPLPAGLPQGAPIAPGQPAAVAVPTNGAGQPAQAPTAVGAATNALGQMLS